MYFFKVKHCIGHISGMVGPIYVKRKGGALVGYWVNYVTLTYDITYDLALWFFKVKFQNSCIWGIVIWLMWNKKKANQILGWLYGFALWPHPWPWPCSLKVKVWNNLISGMGVGALIDKERKGCESIIHDHDCDLWVDVPYSDWGDFRRRRAVDIIRGRFCMCVFISTLTHHKQIDACSSVDKIAVLRKWINHCNHVKPWHVINQFIINASTSTVPYRQLRWSQGIDK